MRLFKDCFSPQTVCQWTGLRENLQKTMCIYIYILYTHVFSIQYGVFLQVRCLVGYLWSMVEISTAYEVLQPAYYSGHQPVGRGSKINEATYHRIC